jgi:anti-sigma factor RsiW
MHVEEGLLQALLDGEVDEAAAAQVRRHLDGCGQCHSQLEALRAEDQWLEGVLRSIDHPAPRIPVEAVAMRARRSRRTLRWAAVAALFLLAAGTAYALPGSPVRRWIDQLVGSRRGKATVPVPDVAGVALPTGGGQHFSIVFTAPHAPGSVTITLTDDSTIVARRRGGVATFAAEIDRLRIETGGAPTDFEIAIPRQASWVEVVVGNRRVFLKQGPRITTEARTDALGRYIISL